MFTLDQIRGFIVVAEELHFGHAADRLKITQPPLSRQIQNLEKAVGTRLLERDNRRVQLTPAGEVFLAEARRLLIAADRAPAAARRVAAGLSGTVTVGFTASSAFGLLGPLLSSIAAVLPGIELELQEMVTTELLVALSEGSLDLCLAHPPYDDTALDAIRLVTEDLKLAVPAAHPLAVRGLPVSNGELADLPLIMHHSNNARYFHNLIISNAAVNEGNVVHVVSQIVTMLSLVAAGRGAAFVPQSALILGIANVVYLPLADFPANLVNLDAIWRRDSHNPAVQQVVAAIAAASPFDDAVMATRD